MKPVQIALFGEPKLKSFSEDQTPTYRTAQNPRQCSYVELLATIIGGSTQIEIAEAISRRWPTAIELRRTSFHDLLGIYGLGKSRAAALLAALELGRMVVASEAIQKPHLHSPQDAADLVMYEMSALSQEELWVLLLDTRNALIAIDKVYKGSVNSTQIRVNELFRAAIKANAPAVIVVHNHPSGDPTPSPDDVAVTRAIVQAGKLLDIDVLDHVVVAGSRFVSLKERGMGFT